MYQDTPVCGKPRLDVATKDVRISPSAKQLQCWRRSNPGKPLRRIESHAIASYLSPHGLSADEILLLPVELGLTLLEESRFYGRDEVRIAPPVDHDDTLPERNEIGDTFDTRIGPEQVEAMRADAVWENNLAEIQIALARLDRDRQTRKARKEASR